MKLREPIHRRSKPRYFGTLSHLGRRNTHRFNGIGELGVRRL